MELNGTNYYVPYGRYDNKPEMIAVGVITGLLSMIIINNYYYIYY